METIDFSHLSPSCSKVHIGLVNNVRSAATLREHLIHASSMEGPQGDIEREKVNFAFIDAKLIVSLSQLISAIHQSLLAASTDNLRTKTVHSEILWSLCPTNNISEAFRLFGVNAHTQSLIIVRIDGDGNLDLETLQSDIVKLANGELASLDGIGKTCDLASVRKYYKLNSPEIVKFIPQNASLSPDQRHRLDDIVTSIVATKPVQ